MKAKPTKERARRVECASRAHSGCNVRVCVCVCVCKCAGEGEVSGNGGEVSRNGGEGGSGAQNIKPATPYPQAMRMRIKTCASTHLPCAF